MDKTEENSCKFCGKQIVSAEEQKTDEGRYCTGERAFITNPFAVEIHDDYTKHWICPGRRYELEMDV